MLTQQKGLVPILLILLAALGLILFLLITNTASFKDKLFSFLYPKPSSFAQQAESVPDEILLKFKPGVPDHARERILNSHALQKVDSIPQIEVELTKVAEEAKDKVIEALNNNPLIEYAEPNFLGELAYEPNDPAWVLSATAQWALKKIGGAASWDITKGSASLIAAVIDSGMKMNHEDLIGKAVKPWNVASSSADVTDTNGHGTAVSGVVGALTDNGKGAASLGWLTSIMPVKITTSTGSLTVFTVSQGLIYAADNGAKVANMSLVFSGTSTTLKNGIDYAYNKGTFLVAAAGNSGTNVILFPAAYDNVIAVGATDASDVKTSWSSYGPQLDVVAPGSGIYSTAANGSYGSFSGTSLATPFVTALSALIFSVNPSLTPKQVMDIITSTALDLGSPGWDELYGWGRIQADKALQKAVGITPSPDTTAPTTSISSPSEGATVSGIVDIQASAADNAGVIKVEFYVDGNLHATDVTSPYLASWDTALYANGSHTLLTKAYDLAGNVGSSPQVTVTVSNTTPTPTPIPTPNPLDNIAPTVSITQPLDGSIVQRNSTVNIIASASDNIKISKVEFYVNNSLKCLVIASPYTCSWKVPGKPNTTHTIQTKAYDPNNNIGSASIKVTSSK